MEVRLNSNGWHRKLQEFVFDNPPKYNSLCPYFWLTIFCFIFTFMIPIVPIGKFIPLIGKFFFWILDGIDKHICLPIYDSMIKNTEDSKLIKMWSVWSWQDNEAWINYNKKDANYNEDWNFWRNSYTDLNHISYKRKIRLQEGFNSWKKQNPDWEEKIELIKAKRKEEYSKYIEDSKKRMIADEIEKDKKREAKRIRLYELEAKMTKSRERKQKVFTNIAIYTKYLAYVLAAGVIGLIAFGLYNLGIYVYEHTIWAKLPLILLYSFYTILILVSFIGLIFLIIKIVNKCKIDFTEIIWLRKACLPFVWLWKGIAWTGKKIGVFFTLMGEGFKFVGIFIKNTKDDYCPGIIWTTNENEK